jgi:hypothetical protein
MSQEFGFLELERIGAPSIPEIQAEFRGLLLETDLDERRITSTESDGRIRGRMVEEMFLDDDDTLVLSVWIMERGGGEWEALAGKDGG